MTRRMIPVLAAIAGLTGVLGAQAPQAPAAQGTAPAAAPAQAEAPRPPSYTYDPEGRRDPFVSLVGRGADQKGTRIAGLPGMLIQEVSLKGIMRQSEGFVALIEGPDRKTYVARTGTQLLDGTVKSISADAIVFSQDVNDPLSLVKQREVRKTLRSEEGQG